MLPEGLGVIVRSEGNAIAERCAASMLVTQVR